MHIQFYIRFKTVFGQSLWLNTNENFDIHPLEKAFPMSYLNEEFWLAEIKIKKEQEKYFSYKYILKKENGEIVPEHGNDRIIALTQKSIKEIIVVDTWNHAGEYENIFYTAPFKNTLLKQKTLKSKSAKKVTHIFKVKAPLLKKDECICLAGNCNSLGNWSVESPVVLSREENYWVCKIDLSGDNFPVAYKYALYNKKEKRLVKFEDGNNRLVHTEMNKKNLCILHDGFIRLPNNTWKGAGVAIPVFSLRSKKSFGVGEFTDLKLLVDWAKTTGLKMIQILPVNDTTTSGNWADSYPYAAISAFALHPIYISLEKIMGKIEVSNQKWFAKKQKELNALPDLDYSEVFKIKISVLKDIFSVTTDDFFDTDEFRNFFVLNKHWLIPYAAFCYLRDKSGTSDHEKWKTHAVYNKKQIEKLSARNSSAFREIAFYYFVQHHLHLQLKDVAEYAHKKGVVLKGDIAIGVYRYGCDTWVDPELYNLQWQAGAPPDDFAVKGQNWRFPTYNWQKMQEDHFEWWRKRFQQMSNYFDAFRIDHILGFFRIWSIPEHAVEGIMGRFIPAIPVSVTEFGEKGIWFDQDRFCNPFITEDILNEKFPGNSEEIKSTFFTQNENKIFQLKPEFDTQRKLEIYFQTKEGDPENEKIKTALYDLISNVILFEEPGSKGQQFHFRIAMENTASFRQLATDQQLKLKELYSDYFYQRQDDFWRKEALHKLLYLKNATNMLICGEDLGMVPHCVPEVMNQLGILSLEIQRMPKKDGIEFLHPNEAPYLSVITPSTHDMSTIRGWWEEDREKTAHFFHTVLEQKGIPPFYCDAWINRAIVLQHLYSPVMWSVFLLQDLLGSHELIRRENPHEERINVPADPNHHWKYRMHLTLEELISQKEFNEELKGYIQHSGR